MRPFYKGLLIGLFLGANLGIFVLGLLCVAREYWQVKKQGGDAYGRGREHKRLKRTD